MFQQQCGQLSKTQCILIVPNVADLHPPAAYPPIVCLVLQVALGLQYASTQLLKIMEVPSAAALRPRITKMWR